MGKILPLLFLAVPIISCGGSKVRVALASPLTSDQSTDDSIPTMEDTTPLSCPDDMVEIEGDYCPNVEKICLYYVDRLGNRIPPGDIPEQTGRCGEFKNPTRCLSKTKIHKHFCIDKYEYPNVEGKIPESWMTWYDSKKACESVGKRMATKSEWSFACSGIEMHPYPYGDGYHRDHTSCNTDNPIPAFDRFKDTKTSRLMDILLSPSGSMPDCVSPFGVYDMVGNIDEQVVNETGYPYHSGLVGGHTIGVRNNCFAMTDGHNESFGWWETGTRCAKDL